MEPLWIRSGEQAGVNEIGLLNKGDQIFEQRFQHFETIHVHSREAIQVDGVHHAANGEILDVRGFATQDADDLIRFALKFEGLKIVRKKKKIDFRAQTHGRMTPVAVRENAKLAAGDEAFDFVLNGFELAMRISWPSAETVCDGGCARRIGLGNGGYVDPIKRG